MKKRANLPALITGIAAFCLWAFLLLLIRSYACQLGYTFLPKSSLEYPCAGVPPDLPISTAASVPVTNSQLRVSFKQPESWALIVSGTDETFHTRYAEYGLKGRPSAPTFGISQNDVGGAISSQDDLDVLVSTETSSWRKWGAHDIEGLYETIDGIPAGGVRYILGGKVGFHLLVGQPRLTYIFDWASVVKYSDELEQIYRAMLPTIRFTHAPP